MAIVLLRMSMIINDRFVLFTFKVSREIGDEKNVGTGYVVGGMSIATGLMLSGVLSGTSGSLLLLIRDVMIYWAAGQPHPDHRRPGVSGHHPLRRAQEHRGRRQPGGGHQLRLVPDRPGSDHPHRAGPGRAAIWAASCSLPP